MSPTEQPGSQPTPREQQWPNIADDELDRYHDLFMAAYMDTQATAAFRKLASHGIHAMGSLISAREELARLRTVSAGERLTPQMRNMMAREADVIEKARAVEDYIDDSEGIVLVGDDYDRLAGLIAAVRALDAASPEPPTPKIKEG